MSKLGKFAAACAAVALVLAGSPSAWAEPSIEVPAGATQADIVQALTDVDDGGTVVLLGSEYTLSSALALSRGVTLKGQGRNATVLKGDGTNHRGVEISNAGAILCDLTVSGFNNNVANGVGVYVTDGTVMNCRVTGNKCTAASGKGIGIYLKAGSVINSVIDLNTTWGTNGNQYGAGLYMEDGWVEGCLITGNNGCWDYLCFGNVNPPYYGGGVGIKAGTVVNSTIWGNKTYGRGGGVYFDGTAGRLYNCIIAANDCDMRQEAIELDLYPASATNYLSQCIVGGSADGQYPGLGGWCGLDADYKPTIHSSGVGMGDATIAFKCATDLAGNPRIHGGAADVGCYAFAGDLSACGIGADRRTALVGKTVTLDAIVHTAEDPDSCSWSVTAPDASVIALDGRNPQLTLEQVGAYRLSLTANGQTTELADWLVSAPLTNTVTKTQSILAAVAAAPDGQVILLPDDVYSSPGTIRVRADIHILGAGYTNTTVKSTSSDNIKRVLDVDSPGAVVEGLTVSGGQFKQTASNYSMGAGARIGYLGGTVAFCCIRDCTSGATYSYGIGVALRGEKAVLRDSIVRANTGGTCGGGVYVQNGLVESCLIYENTIKPASAYPGGGLAFSSSKGVVRNTTIVRNSTGNNSGATGGGVYFSAAAGTDQVVNCIILGNTAATADEFGGNDWSMNRNKITQPDPATVFSHCAFDSSLTAYGEGSVSAETTVFADFVNNDFHLVGATCLNKGALYEGIDTALDLDGNPRLFGDFPDLGCYESVSEKFEPTFAVAPKKVFMGSSVTLTPELTGAPEGNLVCRWIFEGDGGTTFTNVSAGAETHTVTLAAGGLYDITLEVFDIDSGESVSKPFAIREAALSAAVTNYVTAAVGTAQPLPPFDSPETASTNLNEVLEKYVLDGCVIVLDEGRHFLRRTLTIADGVTITGAGRDKTLLVQLPSFDKLTRCVFVNHETAVVEKLAVVNAEIANGTPYNQYGSVMVIDEEGGTIRDCMVSNTTCKTIYQHGLALACTSSKGVISRCLAVGNRPNLMVHKGTCGVICATAGRVDDCLVVGNRTDGVSGLYAEGSSEFWNCTVTDNISSNLDGYVDVAGVYVASAKAKVVNCLFAGNIGKPGLKYAPELGGTESVITGTDVLRNCLFRLDDSTLTVGYRCLNTDPRFLDEPNGGYLLSKDSPCRWAGQRADWMAGALDFYGNPRCHGRGHPDIGCQQQDPRGLVLFVR